MDCNYIPRVKDNEGNLHESLLFKTLLEYTANRDLASKTYKATQTEAFKDWFGDSEYVNKLGEPQLYFNKDNDIAFINWRKDTRVIRNAKTRNFNLDENSILKDLMNRGIINKNRRYGEHLLPRPLQGSHELNEFYDDKPKPETLAALQRIRELNQEYKDRYGITEDVVLVSPFGKTYSVKINVSVLERLQPTPTYVVGRRPQGGQFDILRRYKENLVSNLNERLQNLAILKQDPKTKSSKDLAKIIKAKNIIEARVKELQNEIREIDAAKMVSDVNNAVSQDLDRMEKLATSSDYSDLEEALDLAKFYSHSDPEVSKNSHCIFTPQELQNLSDFDRNMMSEWGARAIKIVNTINDKRLEEFIQSVNDRDYVKRAFNNNPLTKEQLLGNMKDLTWFDMFFMDITGGVWSNNGILPQHAMIVAQAAHDSHAAYSKEKLEKMGSILRAAEDAIGKIDNGKYKLSRFILKPTHAVSWNLFYQRDIDGTMTGNLLTRYSRVWEDAEADMRSRFHSLQEGSSTLAALIFKRKWYKSNAVILDITKIPELMNYINDPANGMDFLLPYANSPGTSVYTARTPNQMKEVIAKQKELLKMLKYNYEARIEITLEEEHAASYNDLSAEAKERLRVWLIQNNPFNSYKTIIGKGIFEKGMLPTKTGFKNADIYSNFDYSVKIPRLNRMDENGNIKESTGYYDSSFEIIDNTPALYAFHEVAMDLITYQRNMLPEELKNYAPAFGIGLTTKDLADILYDPTHGFYDKAMEVLEMGRKKWREKSFVKKEDEYYKGKLDLIDNSKIKTINNKLVQGSLKEIVAEFTIEKTKFISAFNKGGVGKINNITKNTRKNELLLNQETINLLAEYLNVSPSIQAIKNKLKINEYDTNGNPVPVNIPIGRIINNFVTNKVVESTTMNLPRSLELFSRLASDYAAKQSIKPYIDTLKKFYEEIKNSSTTNMGQNKVTSSGVINDGERERAKRQFESWYERSVLGYYDSAQIGERKKFMFETRNKIKKYFNPSYTPITTSETLHYTKEEEDKIKRIKEQISSLTNSPEDLILKAQLEEVIKDMGYVKTFTKGVENLLNFIRLQRLGYNLNSALTNFLEGQIANEIAMAAGTYYAPENWYRATRIVRLARRKALSRGKATHPMANLVSILMERYTILQDSQNEFQKAGIKTSFSVLEKLNPMMLNQSVEYLNQSPILLTAIMSQDITANGVTGKLIDALDWKTGRLKSEWRTEENIENWEKMAGQEYEAFKAKLNECIVDTHGDYDRLRGNIAKAGLAGKAFLMFKGWLPRAMYMRLAQEQVKLSTGKIHKGRYRSHTKATATLHGAIVGMSTVAPFALGPWGAVFGAGAGFLAHSLFSDTRSDLTYLQELSLSTKLLARKMIGVPVNRLGNKERIHSTTVQDLANMGFTAAGADNNKFDEIDRRNMLSNLTEMAISLSWMALTLSAKAMLYNTDDDDDDKKRLAHNLIVNRCLTMSQQATMYLNPSTFYQDNITGVAVIRFATNIYLLTSDIGKALSGDNIDNNPANRGGNRLLASARKALGPAPLQPMLGFGTQMDKQFYKPPYDKWFESNLKLMSDKITDERAKKRKELEKSKEYTTKEIDYMMKNVYPTLNEQLDDGRATFILKQEDIKELREARARKKMKEKAKIAKENQEILEKRKERLNK